ncbi:hypothetical protein O181_003257 [Austropuccinia psidii MF-1]|uniref:Uncharacterized protein n=1 Tax=Austropuccinia psidii MF-1 TaxID=1389203 RepID=A0A9Q3GER2_9BASI|nr:hypothetical protein [Austropuccinia psidii MF-1]
MHQPEDRECLFRTRISGRGHLGHIGGWQHIEGNHIHSAIHIPIQHKPQTRGLEGYGPSSSAPPAPQRPSSMGNGKQDVQPGISLGRTWSKKPENLYQRDRLQTRYGNHQSLESTRHFRLLEVRANRIRENKAILQAIEEQLTQTGNTQNPSGSQGVDKTSSPVASHHSGTNRSVAKSHHSSQSQEVSRRIQTQKGKNKTSFNQRQRESHRMIRKLISSPINRDITPTKIKNNVFTPESSLNSDELWLQMSQFAEQTQKPSAELEASHETMKILTASMDKIVKALQ